MLSWNDPIVSVDMYRDPIETTLSPGRRVLDMTAEWAADCGHIHRNLPITYIIEREPSWFDEDGEEYPGDARYLCPICGAEVAPATTTTGDAFRTFMPGPMHATVTFASGRVLELRPKQVGELHQLADAIKTNEPNSLDTLMARFALEADESQWLPGTTHQGAWG